MTPKELAQEIYDARYDDGFDAAVATLTARCEALEKEKTQLDILLSQASQMSMLNRRAYLEEHDRCKALTAERDTFAEAMKKFAHDFANASYNVMELENAIKEAGLKLIRNEEGKLKIYHIQNGDVK